jgi:hypothetical protein
MTNDRIRAARHLPALLHFKTVNLARTFFVACFISLSRSPQRIFDKRQI